MACFHIRWAKGQVDWQCHLTKAEAEKQAQELARPQETFTIEARSDCKGLLPRLNLRVTKQKVTSGRSL